VKIELRRLAVRLIMLFRLRCVDAKDYVKVGKAFITCVSIEFLMKTLQYDVN
jgi:hypothetical protein